MREMDAYGNCENTLPSCRLQFPDTWGRFPVPQVIFAVNPFREIREKCLRHSSFRRRGCLRNPRNREFPCKIPCLQGIRLETGAISTASPASHSCVRPSTASPLSTGMPKIATRDVVQHCRGEFVRLRPPSLLRLANDSRGFFLPGEQARIVGDGRFLLKSGLRPRAASFNS